MPLSINMKLRLLSYYKKSKKIRGFLNFLKFALGGFMVFGGAIAGFYAIASSGSKDLTPIILIPIAAALVVYGLAIAYSTLAKEIEGQV